RTPPGRRAAPRALRRASGRARPSAIRRPRRHRVAAARAARRRRAPLPRSASTGARRRRRSPRLRAPAPAVLDEARRSGDVAPRERREAAALAGVEDDEEGLDLVEHGGGDVA